MELDYFKRIISYYLTSALGRHDGDNRREIEEACDVVIDRLKKQDEMIHQLMDWVKELSSRVRTLEQARTEPVDEVTR